MGVPFELGEPAGEEIGLGEIRARRRRPTRRVVGLDGARVLPHLEPHVDRSHHGFERSSLLGDRVEVLPRGVVAHGRHALVRPSENQALEDVLDLPALMRSWLYVSDISLQQGVEDVVRIHVIRSLDRVDDECPTASGPGLRSVESEKFVAHRLGRVRVANGEHIARKIDREYELRLVRRCARSFLGESGIHLRVREAAYHGPNGGSCVPKLLVRLQCRVRRELPANCDERLSVVELAIEGVCAKVVCLHDW